MKKFMFGSRRAIENLADKLKGVPHAFISIKTPKDGDAMIPVTEDTAGILRLAFDDIDPKQHYPDGFKFRLGDTPFDDAMASEVWKFIDDLPEECSVFIHCDAGLSRSPGLAAGLSKVLNDDDAGYFENAYPNMLVYNTIITNRKNVTAE
jgi:predicted protein tyrosine phosphatase